MHVRTPPPPQMALALLAEKELLVEVEEYPERGHREAAGMMDVELMVLSLSDLAACG